MEGNTVVRTADELFHTARQYLEQDHPDEAVRLARATTARLSPSLPRDITFAGILIDAGQDLRRRSLLREGIQLLKTHDEQQIPEENRFGYHHNLGSGHLALGQFEPGRGPGTRPSLAVAVDHFDRALQIHPNADTHANLARAFLEQGRWIEALDELSEVLTYQPNHHQALAMQADAFVSFYNWIWPHDDLLETALRNCQKAVELAQEEPIYQQKYRSRADYLQQYVQATEITHKQPSHLEQWIWEQRLALNPCPLCRLETPDALDVYTLHNVLDSEARHPSTREVWEIFNALHRSYGTARWSLLQGANVVPIKEDEQIIIGAASPASTYSLETGLQMTALSEFYGLLSQIAFALNSYFHLGHDIKAVDFEKVWHPSEKKQKQGVPTERKALHPGIKRRAARPLSALHRLAQSFEHGSGRYAELRDLRNSLEHHLVTITRSPQGSYYYKQVRPDNLMQMATSMGRIARAALWYFGGAIRYGEFERLKRAQRNGYIVDELTTDVKRI